MKLLFDENLSPHLVAGLSDVFEEILRSSLTQILAFGADQVAAFLALS